MSDLVATVARIKKYCPVGARVMFSWPENRWYQGVIDGQYPGAHYASIFVEELGYSIGIPQWDLYRPRRHD